VSPQTFVADSSGPSGAGAAGESIYERRRREIVEASFRGWYSPVLHVAIPAAISVTVAVLALLSLRDVRPIELLTIPATLILGFGFEWRVHKFVLHRRLPLLSTLYERHELHHHVIYTYENFTMRGRREFRLVLVPAYAVVLIALVNAPIAWALGRFVAPNVACVYLATSMLFFITYEWLHLAYHFPPDTFVGRLRLIAKLREHHRRHHDPRLMKTWNFNVTVPLFDWIHRTTWSPEHEAERAGRRARRRSEPAGAWGHSPASPGEPPS
jgi:hypothetical protein